MRARKPYNPMVARVRRSRLLGMMSKSTMLLICTGRRSGRTYTTPVNYVRDGDELLCVGPREHTWWKNLRGGATVTARLRGRDLRGTARTLEGEAAKKGLLAVLRAVSAYRRYWKVELGEDGQPEDRRDLRKIAAGNAVVRIRGLEPASGIRDAGVGGEPFK